MLATVLFKWSNPLNKLIKISITVFYTGEKWTSESLYKLQVTGYAGETHGKHY